VLGDFYRLKLGSRQASGFRLQASGFWLLAFGLISITTHLTWLAFAGRGLGVLCWLLFEMR